MARLQEWAAIQPKKLAVRMANGEALSYRELDERAQRTAHWLLGLGLREGDCVALLLENRIETFELWWGARRAGLYYVPISIHLTADELSYVLRNSGSRLVIASAATAEVALQAVEALGLEALPHRFTVGADVPGFLRYEPAVATCSVEDDLPQGSVGREFMYSSGTTGFPKGIKRALVPYEKRNDLPPLEQQLRRMFQIDAQTVYLHPSPLYHATGRFIVRVIETGGSCVVMPRFDAAEALEAIERYKVTHGHWVPTMFIRLLALEPAVRERFDVSSLRVALHATSPCPIPVKQAMIEWWGPVIHEYYGGSENVGVTFIDATQWLEHRGSVGLPITGAVHIVAEDDPQRELPTGEIGQIYFSGGLGFEYHGDPDKTRSAFNAMGWGTYGDLGHVDADGFLFISDRRTDLIISGGVNIYPQEIENVLAAHPAVAEVAVIGVPNADFGQEVKAVVVPCMGHEPGLALAVQLQGWCENRLSRFKHPRSVDFVESLPRNENGKLLKRVLREHYMPAPVTESHSKLM